MKRQAWPYLWVLHSQIACTREYMQCLQDQLAKKKKKKMISQAMWYANLV